MKLLENIHRCDVSTFSWCMRFRYQTMAARVSQVISHSGDGYLYLLIGLLVYLLVPSIGLAFITTALLAFGMERPIYFVMKNCCKRNRPAAAITGFKSFIEPSDEFSFPSGHTAAAFVMAGLISEFFPNLAIFAYFWSTLIGLARIFLGVHFPTDVLMGAVLGSAAITASLAFL